MQLGMVGLGRMGANMARRLLKGGHRCVAFDTSSQAVNEIVAEKAVGAGSPSDRTQPLLIERAGLRTARKAASA